MQNKIAKIIKIILLIFGAFLMVFPFVWMLATSLKTLPEATAIPPIMFPKEAQFQITQKQCKWHHSDSI